MAEIRARRFHANHMFFNCAVCRQRKPTLGRKQYKKIVYGKNSRGMPRCPWICVECQKEEAKCAENPSS